MLCKRLRGQGRTYGFGHSGLKPVRAARGIECNCFLPNGDIHERTMSDTGRPLFHLEITEDANTGVSIRLRHFGRVPNILAGIPRDVLRRSRPWVWNSYERKVLRKARSMSKEAYRLIRDTLILERSKMVMAEAPHRSSAKRLSFLQRRRLWQNHKSAVQQMSPAERVTRNLALSMKARGEHPSFPILPTVTPTLTEAMRDLTRTALSEPRPRPSRDLSR